jgi:GT2 family glycosyltransferase
MDELAGRGIEGIGVDIDEMDITDGEAVMKVIGDAGADAVIHCAAYTAVDAAEDNEELCRAVNAGISMSRGKYVLLLNNDVVCDPEMVSSLRSAMDSRPQAFSCCAKLLQMSDPSRIDDAGDFLSIFGWAMARGKGLGSALYTKEEKVFACCAAAAIYRRSMLDGIGWFDERHFAYLEDMDIGYRALRHGFEN